MALPSLDSDAELVLCRCAAAGRLEPKGEAEVPEINIVLDAVEGTFVNLDGESLQEEQKGKYQRERESGSGQKELIGTK